MFKRLLATTVAAFTGNAASDLMIGIGILDAKLGNALGVIAKQLPGSRVTLKMYCPEPALSIHPCSNVQLVATRQPEHDMISAFKAGQLQAIIRGQLPSTPFLLELKRQFSIDRLYRLALLSTHTGEDFFFAPVGIDEAATPADKQRLIELANTLLQQIGIEPSFYLLSAGRIDDVDRDATIATSIRQTLALVDTLKQQHPAMAVQHGEILIENAFARGANTIIAPEGISGNLIYRTLLHLGGGTSHGAYYLNEGLPGPVMDTSRVGTVEEHAGAVILALRLLAARAGNSTSR